MSMNRIRIWIFNAWHAAVGRLEGDRFRLILNSDRMVSRAYTTSTQLILLSSFHHVQLLQCEKPNHISISSREKIKQKSLCLDEFMQHLELNYGKFSLLYIYLVFIGFLLSSSSLFPMMLTFRLLPLFYVWLSRIDTQLNVN